jgi:hypothetical protein
MWAIGEVERRWGTGLLAQDTQLGVCHEVGPSIVNFETRDLGRAEWLPRLALDRRKLRNQVRPVALYDRSQFVTDHLNVLDLL